MQLRSVVQGALAVLALAATTTYIPAFAQEPGTKPEMPSAPSVSSEPKFPPVDPKNFTATAPTRETVEAFLHVSWGYDSDRVWQVAAIQTTPAPNVSKVTVFVAQKSNPQQQVGTLVFYTTPDGNHLIASDVMPFGAHPYAEMRRILDERAQGPSRGAADKKFTFVEFADFQCPHCKEAQANMEKLATDFPKARIVFQNYPLKIHPEAKHAASYGVCVAKLGGSSAFFQFASAVFDAQDGLGTADGATLTLNSAVTKAGLDPTKIAACASNPDTDKDIESSVKLAEDLNVNQTPMLLVNGRQLPINQIPYDTLKQIILYQAKIDGVTAQ